MTNTTGVHIHVRPTCAADWRSLKDSRLAALLDAPTAFGGGEAVGMIGGAGARRHLPRRRARQPAGGVFLPHVVALRAPGIVSGC